MMEKIRLIVNPEAAGGRAKEEFPKLKRVIDENRLSVDVVFSEYPGHSIELAKNAFNENVTRIISFGGDGTHNEVSNGILSAAEESFKKDNTNFSDEEKSKISMLGLVSIGSGNDFRKSLKLPKDIVDAFKIAITGVPKFIDIGSFEYSDFKGERKSRYFLNILSGGFSGTVTVKANRSKKSLFKGLVYIGALLNTLLFSLVPDGLLRHESHEVNGKFFEFDISNGKYFGGGMLISPFSEVDDGYLNISLFRDYTGLEVLFKLKKLFDGTIIKEKKLYYEKTKEVFVKCNPPATVEADGEVVGYTPIRARIIEKALRVIIP